jgi:hypothetical protein
MPRRSTSLNNLTGTAITREIDSKYDVIKAVSNYLTDIETVADADVATLIAELEAAQDFSGISVVTGSPVNWDAVNKILTVPKGDTGNTGAPGDDGADGVIPVLEFSMDAEGNLLYEVVAYETLIGATLPIVEEW